MSKWLRRGKAPDGFERISPVLERLDRELREKMNEPHEGKRKCESLWPVHQINWQKSRFVYDMYYTFGRISRQVYEFCLQNKLVDANLIAKWKKPGYEKLCSTFAINPKNYNYGTVSICRVPKHQLSESQVIQEKHSGCRGCASGAGGYYNIFGNKYGQYLAKIQVFRAQQAAQHGDHDEPPDFIYGDSIWASKEEEDAIFEMEQREKALAAAPTEANKQEQAPESDNGDVTPKREDKEDDEDQAGDKSNGHEKQEEEEEAKEEEDDDEAEDQVKEEEEEKPRQKKQRTH